ncbi:helix-turn-helix domain-containing protein [Bacillus aquiflavi]|uniref:helix-turn-helix domain-containing protein n=1 Tax=Bacillus aquiflavi TaxID=2672567 RepID=UPI001CAA30BA|nr:helix-turn-helix domain-containing protein [Bacillus aquiflavi]UAC47107.1 helix-turn-helix domain-containing protein [Bacillus aquiflavi]
MEHAVELFKDKKWIDAYSTESYALTNKGEEILLSSLKKQPFPKYLNGWRYHHMTDRFWKRLSLLIQVCSYLIKKENRYVPIQKCSQTRQWIKNFLQTVPCDRNMLAEKLYVELTDSMENKIDLDPRTFVLRLTGYKKKNGLTPEQAAKKLQMDITLFHFHFLNILHYLIAESTIHKDRLIILHTLNGKIMMPFTNSTRKTYEFLKEGYSIDEIMHVRHLKKGTIEDHLVEIALNDHQFNILPFVDERKQEQILHVANKERTKQLKYIKEQVDNASYFEIRLVLAKLGDEQWS